MNQLSQVSSNVASNQLNTIEKTRDFGPIQLVVLQSTTFCNLNCDYCYLPNREVKKQLSLDLLEPIFKHLFNSQFVSEEFTVVWHAGEPLTAPISFYEQAIDKIAQLNQDLNANRCKIFHAIQTNGTLINQAWCDLIKTHHINIGISLDGPAFLHDARRKTRKGLGTHASTMRGISLLQKNNIEFHVIAVLTQDSLDFPEELFNFFVDNQIRHVGFNIEEVEGSNTSSSFENDGAEEKYRTFMRTFYELTKKTNGYLKIREFEHAKGLILGGVKLDKGQFTPFTMVNIGYDGSFTTFSPELLSMESSTYGDFVLGNVLSTSFDAVCETDKFKRINEDIQAGVDLCKRTCQYFSVCGGGAPSNKYFENGTFRSSETMYCRYTKQILTDVVLEDIERSLGLEKA